MAGDARHAQGHGQMAFAGARRSSHIVPANSLQSSFALIGNIPPAEAKANTYSQSAESVVMA